jgi:hypothetical protein
MATPDNTNRHVTPSMRCTLLGAVNCLLSRYVSTDCYDIVPSLVELINNFSVLLQVLQLNAGPKTYRCSTARILHPP